MNVNYVLKEQNQKLNIHKNQGIKIHSVLKNVKLRIGAKNMETTVKGRTEHWLVIFIVKNQDVGHVSMP